MEFFPSFPSFMVTYEKKKETNIFSVKAYQSSLWTVVEVLVVG